MLMTGRKKGMLPHGKQQRTGKTGKTKKGAVGQGSQLRMTTSSRLKKTARKLQRDTLCAPVAQGGVCVRERTWRARDKKLLCVCVCIRCGTHVRLQLRLASHRAADPFAALIVPCQLTLPACFSVFTCSSAGLLGAAPPGAPATLPPAPQSAPSALE